MNAGAQSAIQGPQSAITFPEGLYVHLPFCAALCTYCDFASEVYAAARAQRYLKALENELSARTETLYPSPYPLPQGEGGNNGDPSPGPPRGRENNSNGFEQAGSLRYRPRTVFLGGGTPSALNIPELTLFFDLLRRHVDLSGVEEFTIEANPGSTESAKLEFLLKQGVNRISFGVQSFQPHLLKLLGRVHGADQGREAVAMARAAGFTNVSIDLMHGLPTQSLDDLKRDLDEAIKLGTDHLSAYGLIYEDGTPLKGAVERGMVASLSDEEERAHYLTVMETLEAAGLPQYEISNYAKPGREAQHNLIYWRNEAYLGVGVSAASFIGLERATNFHEMDKYMKGAEESGCAIDIRETLDAQARARESLILEMRLRTGVDPAEFSRRWDLDIERHESLLKFMREGLIEKTPNGRYRISRLGMPVADGILAEFV